MSFLDMLQQFWAAFWPLIVGVLLAAVAIGTVVVRSIKVDMESDEVKPEGAGKQGNSALWYHF